jgi:hypothetical protein
MYGPSPFESFPASTKHFVDPPGLLSLAVSLRTFFSKSFATFTRGPVPLLSFSRHPFAPSNSANPLPKSPPFLATCLSPLATTSLTPFLATHPRNRLVTPAFATLPNSLDLKSFICHTSRKRGGCPPLQFPLPYMSASSWHRLQPVLAPQVATSSLSDNGHPQAPSKLS